MSAGSPRPRDPTVTQPDSESEMAPSDIECVNSRTVYRNRWMSVREDDIRRSDGSTGVYGVVDRTLGVVVIPRRLDSRGEVWLHLVEQFRYPVGARRWELPAGTVNDGTTDPTAIAERELREETGLSAAELTVLSVLDVAPGFTAQRTAVVLAEQLSDGRPERESTETDMRGRWWAYADVQTAIAAGKIVDAQSLAALSCLNAHTIGQ